MVKTTPRKAAASQIKGGPIGVDADPDNMCAYASEWGQSHRAFDQVYVNTETRDSWADRNGIDTDQLQPWQHTQKRFFPYHAASIGYNRVIDFEWGTGAKTKPAHGVVCDLVIDGEDTPTSCHKRDCFPAFLYEGPACKNAAKRNNDVLIFRWSDTGSSFSCWSCTIHQDTKCGASGYTPKSKQGQPSGSKTQSSASNIKIKKEKTRKTRSASLESEEQAEGPSKRARVETEPDLSASIEQAASEVEATTFISASLPINTSESNVRSTQAGQKAPSPVAVAARNPLPTPPVTAIPAKTQSTDPVPESTPSKRQDPPIAAPTSAPLAQPSPLKRPLDSSPADDSALTAVKRVKPMPPTPQSWLALRERLKSGSRASSGSNVSTPLLPSAQGGTAGTTSATTAPVPSPASSSPAAALPSSTPAEPSTSARSKAESGLIFWNDGPNRITPENMATISISNPGLYELIRLERTKVLYGSTTWSDRLATALNSVIDERIYHEKEVTQAGDDYKRLCRESARLQLKVNKCLSDIESKENQLRDTERLAVDCTSRAEKAEALLKDETGRLNALLETQKEEFEARLAAQARSIAELQSQVTTASQRQLDGARDRDAAVTRAREANEKRLEAQKLAQSRELEVEEAEKMVRQALDEQKNSFEQASFSRYLIRSWQTSWRAAQETRDWECMLNKAVMVALLECEGWSWSRLSKFKNDLWDQWEKEPVPPFHLGDTRMTCSERQALIERAAYGKGTDGNEYELGLKELDPEHLAENHPWRDTLVLAASRPIAARESDTFLSNDPHTKSERVQDEGEGEPVRAEVADQEKTADRGAQSSTIAEDSQTVQ